MNVLRPRLCRLPIQRSVLAAVADAGPLLGGPGAPVVAVLDGDGDLRADLDVLAALAAEAPLDLADLGRDRVEALDLAVARAAGADAAAPAEARVLVEEVAAAAAGVVPFAVAAKAVPDALRSRLVAAGDDGPLPFPSPSPGTVLAADLVALAGDCDGDGWPPARLAAAWPAVPAEVAHRVLTWCARHTGWGPLTWEAPGHEDAATAVAFAAAAAGDRQRRALAAERLATPPRPVDPSPTGPTAAVRAALAWWLEFLEWETWHVRRAFHAGIRPLLARLPGGSDLLFCTVDEIAAGGPLPDAVPARRAAYLADTAYLARHRVDRDGLDRLVRPVAP